VVIVAVSVGIFRINPFKMQFSLDWNIFWFHLVFVCKSSCNCHLGLLSYLSHYHVICIVITNIIIKHPTHLFLTECLYKYSITSCVTAQVLDNYGYHYALHDQTERRSCLEMQYHFTCGCNACTEDWPNYSLLRSSNPAYLCTRYLSCNEHETTAFCD